MYTWRVGYRRQWFAMSADWICNFRRGNVGEIGSLVKDERLQWHHKIQSTLNYCWPLEMVDLKTLQKYHICVRYVFFHSSTARISPTQRKPDRLTVTNYTWTMEPTENGRLPAASNACLRPFADQQGIVLIALTDGLADGPLHWIEDRLGGGRRFSGGLVHRVRSGVGQRHVTALRLRHRAGECAFRKWVAGGLVCVCVRAIVRPYCVCVCVFVYIGQLQNRGRRWLGWVGIWCGRGGRGGLLVGVVDVALMCRCVCTCAFPNCRRLEANSRWGSGK